MNAVGPAQVAKFEYAGLARECVPAYTRLSGKVLLLLAMDMSKNHGNRRVGEAVRQLSDLLARAEQSGQPAVDWQSNNQSESADRSVTSGCGAIDRLLQRNGFLRGSLVEWLGSGAGCGASLLALVAARQACADGGSLVVIDSDRTFYPPTAAVWGIDLQRTIVVRPENNKDAQWALDQALQCEHVAAVLAWPRKLDSYTFRRLQLAAESSGCLGLLVRPLVIRKEPSWADVRLSVAPIMNHGKGWRQRVQLLRCRGRFGTGEIEIEISNTGEIHETHSGNLAPQLADATSAEQTA